MWMTSWRWETPMAEHDFCCGCEACCARAQANYRATQRLAYVRRHAPTILAGIAANPESARVETPSGSVWDIMRRRAIAEAGFIFDETEVKRG